jgi:cytochrome P450 family 2 subfamily J
MRLIEYELKIEEQLVVTCMDLFVAGSDTTTATLRFALLYLVLHPNVQCKIQAELTEVVGADKHVSLLDRPRSVLRIR